MQPGEVLSLGEVLLLVLAGGAIGGILDLFHKIEFRRGGYVLNEEALTFSSMLLLLLQAVLIGAGGAIAILLLLTWAGRFASDRAINNVLFLLALSLVSGFAGRRLLPYIAARLEREIAETKKEVEATKEEAEIAHIWAKYSEAVAVTLTAMEATALPADELEAIRALSALKDEFLSARITALRDRTRIPVRRVYIFLGRIYKKQRDFDNAIMTMTEFLGVLEERKRKGETTDKDTADALYNRACYYALKWVRFDDERFKESVYRDLAASVALSPENKIDARSDGDFEELRTEGRFGEIVGRLE